MKILARIKRTGPLWNFAEIIHHTQYQRSTLYFPFYESHTYVVVGIEFVSYFALFPKIDFSDQFEANAI
jgi:hypothetical protein